jgi:hypothetical protein
VAWIIPNTSVYTTSIEGMKVNSRRIRYVRTSPYPRLIDWTRACNEVAERLEGTPSDTFKTTPASYGAKFMAWRNGNSGDQ